MFFVYFVRWCDSHASSTVKFLLPDEQIALTAPLIKIDSGTLYVPPLAFSLAPLFMTAGVPMAMYIASSESLTNDNNFLAVLAATTSVVVLPTVTPSIVDVVTMCCCDIFLYNNYIIIIF